MIYIDQVHSYSDAGIDAFDTANASDSVILNALLTELFFSRSSFQISNGKCEIILGKVIKLHKLPRQELIVFSQIFFTVSQASGELYASPTDNGKNRCVPAWSQQKDKGIEVAGSSSSTAQLDYIDGLQCERQFCQTIDSISKQGLHEVVKAGYVRYIGMRLGVGCASFSIACCIYHHKDNYCFFSELSPNW
ncbi:hypothetical protein EV421DRAFT_1708173 [Armillaria borealis]|uniref:NADP-dependent oxidoreductase domain-containing protein n=1 Tax=Armillaria borealis TaxID=47425 RepID=A0AA39JNF9_9AGAR|nr:hypothetical protein EV421DRAFT_1708173 [Armillaria borealis]